eukprot:Amastigsp_a342151_11.p7 type:complete len:105 gc:universal Amastigsp_a342151_11:589-903(+)
MLWTPDVIYATAPRPRGSPRQTESPLRLLPHRGSTGPTATVTAAVLRSSTSAGRAWPAPRALSRTLRKTIAVFVSATATRSTHATCATASTRILTFAAFATVAI